MKNLNPGGREKLWKAISNELDMLVASRKRKIAAIPYLLIASFIGIGVLTSQDGHFLKTKSFLRSILGIGIEKQAAFNSKETAPVISISSHRNNAVSHQYIQSQSIPINSKTVDPVIYKNGIALIEIPVSHIIVKKSSTRKGKNTPGAEPVSVSSFQLSRSLEWDNVALAGRGHAFVAVVGSSLSRSPEGFISYANFAGAGFRLRHSKTVLSLYHSHSFNEYFAGTQTSMRISMPVLNKKWGSLIAGIGLGYLTRSTYKMPLDAVSSSFVSNVATQDVNIYQRNALGMEAGVAFVRRHLIAGISVANFNHPRLTPSKYGYKDPVLWEAGAAGKFQMGSFIISPNVTLRNSHGLNADAMIYSKYKALTTGAGISQLSFSERKLSPSLYAGWQAGKNLEVNASVTFAGHRDQISSYGLSSRGNILSLGVKYAVR
jgi:hypothetical protein